MLKVVNACDKLNGRDGCWNKKKGSIHRWLVEEARAKDSRINKGGLERVVLDHLTD